MASNPRKDPFRIRKKSTKEFSRVSSMIMARLEELELRVDELERKLGSRERSKKKPKDEPLPEAPAEAEKLEEKKE